MIAHVGFVPVEETLLPLMRGVAVAKGRQPAFLASKPASYVTVAQNTMSGEWYSESGFRRNSGSSVKTRPLNKINGLKAKPALVLNYPQIARRLRPSLLTHSCVPACGENTLIEVECFAIKLTEKVE